MYILCIILYIVLRLRKSPCINIFNNNNNNDNNNNNNNNNAPSFAWTRNL